MADDKQYRMSDKNFCNVARSRGITRRGACGKYSRETKTSEIKKKKPLSLSRK